MWFKRILTLVIAIAIGLTALIQHTNASESAGNIRVNEEPEVTMDIIQEEVEETRYTTQETQNQETESTVETTEVLETESTIVETQSLETEPVEQIIVETEAEEPKFDIIEYEEKQYKIPRLSLNREPRVSESGYVEKFTEVPQYFQSYYPHIKYGDSNIRKSGCGIACVSMVLTYLLDEEVTIEELAKKYFRYKGEYGSSYTLFTESAKDYGVVIEKQTSQWEDVVEALKNGQVVIANPRAKSYFTNGGHFIVLFGITEDGKILVRDPNLYNYSIWNYPEREDGYANGFNEKSIKYNCFPMWIYAPKDLEAIAAKSETETVEN